MTHTNLYIKRSSINTFSALLFLILLSASSAFAQRGPANVFVEAVQERDFANRIEALGTLEPNESVDLTLNVADRVQSLYFWTMPLILSLVLCV